MKKITLKKLLPFLLLFFSILSSFAQTRLSDVENRFYTNLTPNNVTSVTLTGANSNADSNTLQAQIDATSSAGGGVLIIKNTSGNAVGQYFLLNVELKSNVHLKIASDVELTQRSQGKMFYIGENVYAENVAITNLDVDNTDPSTWAKINLAQGTDFTKNWSFLKIANTSNFKVSGFYIKDNHSRISGITMGADTTEDKSKTPRNGIVKNIVMSVSHVGYGVVQVQASKTVLFKNLDGTGGSTLRLESGLGSLNQDTLLTLDDVVGRDITNRNGDGALVLSPHRLNQGVVDIDRLYAYSSTFAVSIASGFLDKTGSGTNLGVFDSASYIGDVFIYGGNFSQVKSKNFKFYDCTTRLDLADRCGKSLEKSLEIEAHPGKSVSVVKDIASAASGCTGGSANGCYDITFGGQITKGNSDFALPLKNTIFDSDKINGSCNYTRRTTCAQPYPVASFTVSNVGRTYTFNATASTDDGNIVEYEWNFGDGTIGHGQTISHTYSNYNGHAVSLSIRDNNHAITTLLKIVKTQQNIWLGTNDTNWDVASNWSKGTVPTSLDGVLITKNSSVISSGDINVEQLTLNTGSSLTVAGNLTPVSTVTVLNNASLIAKNSATFNLTYKRTITTPNKWNLISSPVIGQNIDVFATASGLTSGSNSNRGLSTYNTIDNTWSYYQAGTTTSGNFTSGNAKSINLTTSKDIQFNGDVVLNGKSISLNATNLGYNLLGNPYASFISANNSADNNNNILKINKDELRELTFWLWNSETENYQPFNQASAAKFIAPTQGFFVRALTNNNFNFMDAMQNHQTTNSFQRTESRPEINIDVYDNTAHKTTAVYYINGTTTSFDNGYDSTIFKNSDNEFSVYTVVVDESDTRKLGIQSLPNSNYENMIIPLEIKVASEKTISINVNSSNFPSGIKTYLEDKKDNSFTLLENNKKQQVSINNATSNRFFIHTRSSVLNTSNYLNSEITIFNNKNKVTIKGLKNEETTTIKVFDVSGKNVFNKIIMGKNNNNFTLSNAKSGIYIIHVETTHHKMIKKIIF